MAKAATKSTKALVIVESPAKAKTIEKFLGTGYKVTASNGHLIDLPKSKIAIDVEHNFEPEYIVIRGRSKILNELKKEAKASAKVYLATDPDREGEAISWHIANALGIPADQCCRIEFNEITKNAVVKAIDEPRPIDVNRVNAQQARRVLDRLVGYKLSPLLWSKVRRGLSAGRVQSVAVRLIVDREDEINNFIPREFWTVTAKLTEADTNASFEAKFYGDKNGKIEPATEEETQKILDALGKSDFVVNNVKRGTRQKRPYAPFTTSTLQQDASKKLGFNTKRTMVIAQGLYEGVKINDSETVGLITYMRTDSTRVSSEAQFAAREFIAQKYGAQYVPEKPNIFTSRKNAQDAHEAIRPTYIKYTPESLKGQLTTDQFKLYQLIYTRFLASQMPPAVYDTISADINAGQYIFRASFSSLAFAGYKAVYQDGTEEDELSGSTMPDLKNGAVCKVDSITPKQNFTSPPPRYTEHSLVKAFEELGIGRPSTYAPIISTIIDRGYIERQQKTLVPTDLGVIVTDLMKKNFPDIVNVKFTAEMEDQLDNIEEDGRDWHDIIRDFYVPFEKTLEKADKEIERVTLPERPAGITCELCGAEMVYKSGRFGEFIACPNYPTCKNTKPILKPIKTPCPMCGGSILQKKSRKGSTFFGCQNYPDCTFVSWDMPLEEKCTACGAYMVQKKFGRKSYKKCSNPECTTNQKQNTKKEEEK